jgi:ribonuclease P protein component
MPPAPERLGADGCGLGCLKPGRPKLGRLKRRAEFRKLAAQGRKAPMPGLVLQALTRDDADPARLGFTVTKKIGNAVVRNRTRRRLKEAARLWLREHPVAGVDLVLIGREGTRKRDFRKLQDDLRRALEKTGALEKAEVA